MNLPKLNLTPQRKMLLILAVVALIATIGIAAAVSYGIRSPDSNPGTVNPTPTPSPSPTPSPTPVPQATLSKVTISPSVVTWGQTWTISTTLSDGLAGVNVDFYDQNGNHMGSSVTDAAGTASISFIAPVGTWIYHANADHP